MAQHRDGRRTRPQTRQVGGKPTLFASPLGANGIDINKEICYNTTNY